MRALQNFRLVLIAWLALAVALRADEATDRAQDLAQMKTVWEALMSFQKANGKLPDRLADLVPTFLADPKKLLSPRDDGAQENGPLSKKDEKHPSSYGYEWGSHPFRGLTFAEVKSCQVEEYGPVVPLLRCFLYDRVLNISHAGEFYETELNWEIDPVVKEIIAKRGLGPGASKGKFLDLTTRDAAGKPLPDVRVKVLGRTVEGVWLPDRTLTTGADGRARIPFGPVVQMQGILEFEKPDYFAFPQGPAGTAFEDALAVVLRGVRRISGTVTDAAGKPLAGANLRVSRRNRNDTPEHPERWFPLVPPGWRGEWRDADRVGVTQSDAAGRWAVESVPDDPDLELKIAVSHPTCGVKFLIVDRRTLENEEYFGGAGRLRLAEPFKLRGTLSDAGGRPVADAPLFLFAPVDPTDLRAVPTPLEGKTDAMGEFEFNARVPGSFEIVAVPKNLTPLSQTVSALAPIPTLDLKLAAGRVLAGRVLDARNRPVPGVQIFFTGWSTGISSPLNPLVATSDAAGNWKWPQAPAGPTRGHVLFPSGTLSDWWEEGNQPVQIRVPLGELE